MRVVLRDAGTEEVGSASQFIQVPDVTKGHLELSSIVLSSDHSKTQATGEQEHPEGHVDEDPNGTPAVRIFKPGAVLAYGYWILNAQADSSRKADLTVQTRLFRDGQEVYPGSPKPLPAAPADDPTRLVGGGRMQLGANIQPGDYVLQVVVTDKLAKEKYQVATQSMDFEIRQ